MQVGNCERKRAEQTSTLLKNNMIRGRKCTKLVLLKPLAAKNGLAYSVLCPAPFL